MTVRRSVPWLVLFVLVTVTTSTAAPEASGGKAQYERCLARATANAADGLREALDWKRAGGGPASEHCVAVALVALRRYVEAATMLEKLAHGGFMAEPAMRMALFDQAGNAWLLAKRADNAIGSFSAALAIDPADADLLADRARANAMNKNWARAESDLSAALMVNPDRADLLVLRGSARHAMHRKADARADFERALRLHPGFVDALVERGTMKFEVGDAVGARADWSQVVTTSPASAAAGVARQHLADTEPVAATAPVPPVVLKPPKAH